MRSKISPSRILLVAVITVIVFSPALVFYFIQQSGTAPLTAGAIAIHEPEKNNSGLPARLNIPKINVDSVVESVGVAPDGTMETPGYPSNVAWFNLGPRPGEIGSAVVAGHYGWKNGKAAAFDNLYKLRKGDKLSIEDERGATISFVVRENRRYDPQADASTVFSSSDGKSHLNLITCEGDWNKDQKSYSTRLVVFTDRE